MDSEERRAVFGAAKGQKRAVVILDRGYDKLDQFTAGVTELYQDLTGPLLAAAFSGDQKLSKLIAEWLVEVAQSRANEAQEAAIEREDDGGTSLT